MGSILRVALRTVPCFLFPPRRVRLFLSPSRRANPSTKALPRRGIGACPGGQKINRIYSRLVGLFPSFSSRRRSVRRGTVDQTCLTEALLSPKARHAARKVPRAAQIRPLEALGRRQAVSKKPSGPLTIFSGQWPPRLLGADRGGPKFHEKFEMRASADVPAVSCRLPLFQWLCLAGPMPTRDGAPASHGDS
jgi:hypothetical protein